MSATVTLLTDFGATDGYAAELKGRLRELAPDAVLVDITHHIAPGDIAAAAYVIARTWQAFPQGTVHLVVVDPGVGSARLALAAEAGGHRFVAPDNGLLTYVLQQAPLTAVSLRAGEGASRTFHGRDVFAPAAAKATRGALRGPRADPVRLQVPPWSAQTDGAVLHVDHFGTLITNLRPRVPAGAAVRVGGRTVRIRTTFADVAPGELVAYVGSAGALEIAVRDGRADQALKVKRGAAVKVSSAS